jgi:hypothetical protein
MRQPRHHTAPCLRTSVPINPAKRVRWDKIGVAWGGLGQIGVSPMQLVIPMLLTQRCAATVGICHRATSATVLRGWSSDVRWCVVRSEQFSAVGRWFHHFPRVWLEVADARATAEVLARAGVSTLADPFEVATGWTVEIANPWEGWTAAWPSLWYPSWPELRHLSIPSKAGACVAFQRWLSSWPACCSPPGPSLAVLQAVRVDAMGAAAMEAICYLVIARIPLSRAVLAAGP